MATLRKIYLSPAEFSRLAEQVNCVGWLDELEMNRPNAEWVIRRWAKRWGLEGEIRRVDVVDNKVAVVTAGSTFLNSIKLSARMAPARRGNEDEARIELLYPLMHDGARVAWHRVRRKRI
jgi:hypothetical protein